MKYKVGDIVTIRSWESMVEEFGVNRDGDIECMCVFVDSMRPFCGTKQTISEVNSLTKSYYVEGDDDYWVFSEDMLEDTRVEMRTELNDDQLARIDAVYMNVLKLCRFMTGNKEMPHDIAVVGEIAEYAADVLAKHGYKVYFPFAETDENGNTVVKDYYV